MAARPPSEAKPLPKPAFLHKHPIWATLLLSLLFAVVVYWPWAMVQRDSLRPFLPAATALHIGRLPLWNPLVNSGCPVFCDPAWVSRLNLFDSLLYELILPLDNLLPQPGAIYLLLNLLILSLFTFLLMRRLGVEPIASVFAAVALAIHPQWVVDLCNRQMQHVLSLSLLPAVLYLAHRLIVEHRLIWLILASLFLTFQFLRSSAVVSMITLLLLAVFIIVSSWTKYRRPLEAVLKSSYFILLPALGLLGAAYILWPLLDSSRFLRLTQTLPTLRWSDLPLFLYQSFNGPWVGHEQTTLLYAGALQIFIIGCLFLLRKKLLIALLAVLLGVLFAGGFFFDALLTTHGWPVLFTLMTAFSLTALNKLPRTLKKKYGRRLEIYMLVVLGAAASFLLILFFNRQFFDDHILRQIPLLTIQQRHRYYLSALADAAAVFMLVGFGFLLIELYLRNKLLYTKLAIGLFLLIAVDVIRVNRHIYREMTQETVPKVTLLSLLQSNEPFRVFSTLGRLPHPLESVTGQAASLLKTYNELLEQTGLHLADTPWLHNPIFSKYTRLISRSGRVIEQPIPVQSIDPARLNFDRAILDMLNVRYLVCRSLIHDPYFRLLHEGDFYIYENLHVLPRAFFVDSIVVAPAGAASFDLMRSVDFDPQRTVILEKQPAIRPVNSSENLLVSLKSTAGRVEAEVEIKSPALLVFSEIYMPDGWSAKIDGKMTTIYRANSFLRAVVLPPGSRRIVMEYRPDSFRQGLLLSGFAGAAYLAGLGRVLYVAVNRRRRKRR
ncbi:MAG: YfhO family protein [candidate division KSB1 bacterium]|nr:YfhO family protein [candidate division KSB1 bacterium]MDZ7346371.1 YfhO family protein [candidate division KSB1 bacterium]